MSRNLFKATLEITQVFNTVHEPLPLLEQVMDIIMKTLGAQRGFILLKTETQTGLEPVVARNISHQTIESIRNISTSVVNRVLQTGEGITSIDAQTDERFAGAQSIIMQNIHSVLCSPLRKGEEIIGAIYLDSQVGVTEFDAESLDFLEAISDQIVVALENIKAYQQLAEENRQLKQKITTRNLFPEIIGQSPAIQQVFDLIDSVADSDATVLIEGESGTGKELVARALHYHSYRADKPFIPIFCGSLTETLLESELFGHRKGAFTGAIENKPGLFEEADGGTLFLDEIGEISKNIQTKLLRVIQEGEIKRVGDSQIRKVNVRIIAATNRDLWEEVQAGNFREDLYYRLNVINIKMPPLRARRDDIPLLADHFLKKYTEKNRKSVLRFTPEALKLLMEYDWPGNIRELENTIERAVILARGTEITPDLIDLKKRKTFSLVGKTLKEIEKEAVLQTLEMTGYNRTKTAEILGVSRRWLQYQLKNWGINPDD